MRTGSIIDFYDDLHGMVLKEKVAEAEVPDFIKMAAFLTMEDRQALPDDVFALVMVDQGEKIRKYACVDKGNTALNVMYFLENRDRLPLEAQKVAAANLLTACEWHELQAPSALAKVAGTIDAIKKLKPKKFEPKKFRAKKVKPRAFEPMKVDFRKVSALNPYVDVTGQQPPPRFSKRASQRFALEDRFPIDSCGEIKEAEAWFGDYGTSLHPAERRAFCQNLTARADELGMPLESDAIHKYAGAGYAPDGELRVACSTRMQYWAEDAPERDLLKGLMDKHGGVPPEVFCESLRQIDEATGLNHHWDHEVADPWYTTYGMQKKAEWSWEYGNDRVTEEELKKGVSTYLEQIKKKFGEDVALSLQKNPVQIFSSLPLDSKRIIVHLANQAEE